MGYGNVVPVVVPGCSVVFFEVGGVSEWVWGHEPEPEQWSEAEAVRLLQEVGAVVAWFEAEGVRIPAERRERCHTRIVEAYKSRDMAAYREAVNGYEQVLREAYRRLTTRRGKGRAGE